MTTNDIIERLFGHFLCICKMCQKSKSPYDVRKLLDNYCRGFKKGLSWKENYTPGGPVVYGSSDCFSYYLRAAYLSGFDQGLQSRDKKLAEMTEGRFDHAFRTRFLLPKIETKINEERSAKEMCERQITEQKHQINIRNNKIGRLLSLKAVV